MVTSRVRCACTLAAIVCHLGVPAMLLAQRDTAQRSALRVVEGRVMRGTSNGPQPSPGIQVVLHRVGSDRAGPLDSVRTDARGRYAFRFRPFGAEDALYFASASYGGIAYFSTPLRSAVERGDDAMITVFDTTSRPVDIHVAGRHVIIGAPAEGGRREVVEVFELGNDTSVTVVSRDASTPVWRTHLPPGAVEPKMNPTGEVAPGAVSFRGNELLVFAPLSPGIRQLSFSYAMPAGAFPIIMPMERPTTVLEILAEEPLVSVTGARLSEIAPVVTSGRNFRRLLAREVDASAVVRIDVPAATGDIRTRFVLAVAATSALAMLAALVFALRRRRTRVTTALPATVIGAQSALAHERASDALVREIALLDAQFEQQASPAIEQRARYDADRAALKARLVDALAAERSSE